MGATMSSEKTAAAEGTVGELRRDPFAMLPFCGYNMADYWGHWLRIGSFTTPEKLPRIYSGQLVPPRRRRQLHLARFRGQLPGPGVDRARLDGSADAVESPIGRLPVLDELDLEGVDITAEELAELFALDPQSWLAESDMTEEYFEQFGDRVPEALREQLQALRSRLA